MASRPRPHPAPLALGLLALGFLCPPSFAEGRSQAPSAAPVPAPDLSAYAEGDDEESPSIEAVIERAYLECFRTFFVDGKVRTLRLPFAENSERSELAGGDLKVAGGGKADPAALWDSIQKLFESADFSAYLAALSDGREKIIFFDLPKRAWTASGDRFLVERMLNGIYPGLPHRPALLSRGDGAGEAELYDYIYCVGGIGIDCSGFVWHVLRAVAKEGGLDLDAAVRREARLPRRTDASLFVGARFFDPRSGRTRILPDRLDALQPGDMLLFRGEDGSFIHSCVVQSVDLAAGRIRYLQSTDESPIDERGVHDSLILFDPAASGASLKDPGLRWTQLRGVAFEGEPPSAFVDDGERFRAYPELGGGIAVRFKALEKTVAKLRARTVKGVAAPAPAPALKRK